MSKIEIRNEQTDTKSIEYVDDKGTPGVLVLGSKLDAAREVPVPFKATIPATLWAKIKAKSTAVRGWLASGAIVEIPQAA